MTNWLYFSGLYLIGGQPHHTVLGELSHRHDYGVEFLNADLLCYSSTKFHFLTEISEYSFYLLHSAQQRITKTLLLCDVHKRLY